MVLHAAFVLSQIDFNPHKSDIDRRNIIASESLAGFSDVELDAVARSMYSGLIGAQKARSTYLEKALARGQVGSDSSPAELQAMWYENLRKEILKLPDFIA